MGTSTLIIYVVFFGALMYFMIFLPQRKRDKKAKELMSALQVGNMVVSIGGMSGKVINLKDDEVTIETSVEKTQVVLKKWAIKEVQKPLEG